MPVASVDLNCDMGEGYGRWQLGADAKLVPFFSSVSVATGYHAGDPPTMRRTVEAAVAAGCSVGAHISFPDLMGFGRRAMSIPPPDLRDYCLYQIGALQAFAEAAGTRLAHVKPHGALYVQASADPDVADAVAAATAAVDPGMRLFLLGEATRDVIAAHGLTLVPEGFPDLAYDARGHLVIEPVKKAWDPGLVARRAVRMATEHTVDTAGGDLPVQARTLCIHGDAPNAVEIARATRDALTRAGVTIAPPAA